MPCSICPTFDYFIHRIYLSEHVQVLYDSIVTSISPYPTLFACANFRNGISRTHMRYLALRNATRTSLSYVSFHFHCNPAVKWIAIKQSIVNSQNWRDGVSWWFFLRGGRRWFNNKLYFKKFLKVRITLRFMPPIYFN